MLQMYTWKYMYIYIYTCMHTNAFMPHAGPLARTCSLYEYISTLTYICMSTLTYIYISTLTYYLYEYISTLTHEGILHLINKHAYISKIHSHSRTYHLYGSQYPACVGPCMYDVLSTYGSWCGGGYKFSICMHIY